MNHPGGCARGAWPLLRGEPVARQCQRFFAGARRALRRGGNPPAPAFPGGETAKGRYRISINPEVTDYRCSYGDILSLQQQRIREQRIPERPLPSALIDLRQSVFTM